MLNYTGIYSGRVIPLTFLLLGVVSVLTGSFWWTLILLLLATVGGLVSSELSKQEEKILVGGENLGGGEKFKIREYISNTFERLSNGANASDEIGGTIMVVIFILLIVSAGLLAIGLFIFGLFKIYENWRYLLCVIEKNSLRGFN